MTITAAAKQTMNVTLAGVLSLGDLGFSPSQTQGNAQDQARLDKRSHMLKMHQRFGLIDAVPLVATVYLRPAPAAEAPVRPTARRIWLWAR